MQEYIICDFCKKPHKKEEIEKIRITYHKCKSCNVNVKINTLAESIKIEPSLVVNNKKIIKRNIMPATIAPVFSRPEGDTTTPFIPTPLTKINNNKQ